MSEKEAGMNGKQGTNLATDEFYIGWQAEAPQGYAKKIRQILPLLLILVLAAGFLLASLQKKFGKGNFEFGQLTTVKGVYLSDPVPSIRVRSKPDLFGQAESITIPLLGYGKFGAYGIIADLEKQNRTSLNGKEIMLKGALLYNDGKTLMQIDANDKPLINIEGNAEASEMPQKKDLGEVSLKGEIVDPKCYFGVMKPGLGKPHKDCAIRCISGGIPPVLKQSDEEGRLNYYLIVGSNGERMNEKVKNFIAEPVSLRAHAVQYGDWIVLFVKEGTLSRTSYLSILNKDLESCGPSCAK